MISARFISLGLSDGLGNDSRTYLRASRRWLSLSTIASVGFFRISCEAESCSLWVRISSQSRFGHPSGNSPRSRTPIRNRQVSGSSPLVGSRFHADQPQRTSSGYGEFAIHLMVATRERIAPLAAECVFHDSSNAVLSLPCTGPGFWSFCKPRTWGRPIYRRFSYRAVQRDLRAAPGYA